MAENFIDLSEEDIEAIIRTVATEVGNDRYIRSHPDTIAAMAEAVADTIINRTIAPGFPNTVSGVVNAASQFSAINGPRGHGHQVYGSWQNVPESRVNPFIREHMTGYLNGRAQGKPSRLEQMGIPGSLHFANPATSSRVNVEPGGWVHDLINNRGGVRLGIGEFQHYHGTARGSTPIAVPQVQIEGVARRPVGPNPARDFNQQELAAIAPPTPALPASLKGARQPPLPATPAQINRSRAATPLEGAPLQERTIAGYIAPGSAPRVAAGVENLRESTRQKFRDMVSLLPQDLRDKTVITSTVRNESSTHRDGGAIDIRNRHLTPFEEAQTTAAAVRAGFEAIGPYDLGAIGRSSPPHIHLGDDRRFNRPGSVFQVQSRDDNPYLSGTQPNSGLYDAVENGFRVSDAWFGPTAPTPKVDVQPRNRGDGSLDGRQSTFPSRPSTPSALPAAPQRAETTPRLSERYAGSDSGSPVLPSSFPARPSMGTGGLPAARNVINSMRAQSEAIQRQTTRPSVPTARISRPATPVPTQQRSPTDFQYATRPPTPPPAPRTPAPITAPQLGSQRGFFSSMQGADYTKPEAVAAPRFNAPNPIPRPTVPPNPVARPSTLPQFGMVPNPVARPNIPQFAGVPAPVQRTRARQVPNPIAAPRRQSPPLLDLAGFNDWVGGIGQSIGNAISPMVTMTPAMANAPTRYAGNVVLPPQPTQAPQIGAPLNLAPRAGVRNDESNTRTQNRNKASWNHPVWGVSRTINGGSGASAHDAFYDSQYGGGGFAW